MRTGIVILNWNTRDYLARFLPPLLDSVRGLDAEVVVADSASTDGSRELLAERFPQVQHGLRFQWYRTFPVCCRCGGSEYIIICGVMRRKTVDETGQYIFRLI